ncbi:Glycosyl transferases group 1 [Marinobacter litoralis]|uniref:Glycosyl transferases group 1 n=1 Tax=Marinobacter litoralis TaxID=187981 RepID=A0A3M2RLU1_9GAMM|nr:selenoneine biosynthesis selenosugar synthase SenB [Marinobacter litoralis]RMJ06326.1 Glycosyl transferases group 1 [Marinobacter litoralis]
MNIIIITPAGPDSKAGNRATALRWQRLLQQSGHQVRVETEYQGAQCDLLIALHAWRSANAIKAFKAAWPESPLIVALTGTDIYYHQHEYPDLTYESMDLSDLLIGLHDLVARDIPERYAHKLLTLRQSADKPDVFGGSRLESGQFHICVLGHLRDEKDSLRAAIASHHLPEDSNIIVSCAGKPHNDKWRELALQESRSNPRFHWLGELNRPELATLIAVSSVMVISSIMEGGANVISEACRAELPILASDIPGNRGLLGDDYPGYFPVKDDKALAELMARTENDGAFLAELKKRVIALAETFRPEQERQSLEKALALVVAAKD